MTISAFGVDHGYEDIEKFGAGIGGGLARLTSSAGGAATRIGQQNAVRTGAIRPKLGGLGARAGGQLKSLGGKMAANPGLTGKVAIGGTAGAAGAGGAGYALGNRRR